MFIGVFMGGVIMENRAIKVIIEKDKPCVCGSGIDFENCCRKKNHRYEGLLREDGTYGIYDETEFVTAAKGLLSFIDLRVEKENLKLTFDSSSKKLNKLYDKLGNTLKPIHKASSCREGCSHCCHLLVLTSKLEYEIIKNFIEVNFSNEDKEKLNTKINDIKDILKVLEHKDEKFTSDSYNIYNKEDIPCAFLDDNNRCTIYSVRPFICRKYLVLNDPIVCEDHSKKTTQYYAKYLTTVKNAIGKLNKLTYDNLAYNHLLSWFLEE